MIHPLTPLTALSPLDGRYAAQTALLASHFSEFALIRHRVQVEVEYLLALLAVVEHPAAEDLGLAARLRALVTDFTLGDAEAVKAHEQVTRHDVKAVEYWLKEQIGAFPALDDAHELVHLGLTSEDVNNLAYALMHEAALNEVLLPALGAVMSALVGMVEAHAEVPMLARTHGQPASPTTMGKELGVFAMRLATEVQGLLRHAMPGKLNGATGTLAALALAYPTVDWLAFSRRFVTSLGLRPSLVTTQIEPRDGYAALYDHLRRVGHILLDLSQDMWRYISDGYFRQRVAEGEVGSSAMPHKVNPIDFENAEGNLGLAGVLFVHLGDKLTVSRLQRDLSDSTVLRNVGVAMGHFLIACNSLKRGLDRVELDAERLLAELDAHPEVLAEAIQTVMRADGAELPYERLKALTRGQSLTLDGLRQEACQLSPERTALWESLTPAGYIGLAPRFAEEAIARTAPVIAAIQDREPERQPEPRA